MRARLAGGVRPLRQRLQRVPVAGTALAVQKRYSEDSAGFLAAGMTYYGFLSLFPLLLLALSGLGYVLASRPDAQIEWTQRISESLPGLGALVGDNLSSLVEHRRGAGIIGLAGLVWSGRGVVSAASHGLARVFRLDEKANFFIKQAWMIGSLLGLGVLALAATAIGTTAGGLRADGFTPLIRVGGTVLTLALDFTLFLVAYRVLAMRRGPSARLLWPGALLAAVGWTALKLAGGWYATRTVANAEAVYGTFAGTIGVLVLLYLASQLFMYGVELNAVLIESGGARHAVTQADRVASRDRRPAVDAHDRQGDRRRLRHAHP